MGRNIELAVEVKNACKLYPPDYQVLNGFNMNVPSGAMYVYNIFHTCITIIIITRFSATSFEYNNFINQSQRAQFIN